MIAAFDNGDIDVSKLRDKSYDELDELFAPIVGKKYSSEIADRFVRKFKTQLSKEDSITVMRMFSEIENGIKKTGYATGSEVKDWALKRVDLDDYLERIVNPDNNLSIPKSIGKFFKDEFKRVADQDTFYKKVLAGANSLINVVTAPVYKSIKASFDLSYSLRQGFKILTKDPKAYKKSWEEAWSVWKSINSQDKINAVLREHKASLISKPDFQKLVDNGLAINVVEDWFPTSIGEKIKLVGNLFKASNASFTVFSQQARYSLASDMLKRYPNATVEQIKAITQYANSLTGRGSLNRFEASSGILNKVLFSARFIRSQFDTFAMPFNPTIGPALQKEATVHLAKTLGTIAAMMATASFFYEVETDPRSSNFGKMKVGDKTWVDLTAGLGGYISLAAKQATGETKSAISGKVKKLNTGAFGSQTRGDVLVRWLENKLAPAPAAINTAFLKGSDFKGDKPTVGSISKSLGVPISIENMLELMESEEGATIVGAWVADVLGASSTTFK